MISQLIHALKLISAVIKNMKAARGKQDYPVRSRYQKDLKRKEPDRGRKETKY